ncbi:MAG: hypothetical protein ACYTGH_14175, partial [Planctomycetota bacterium]
MRTKARYYRWGSTILFFALITFGVNGLELAKKPFDYPYDLGGRGSVVELHGKGFSPSTKVFLGKKAVEVIFKNTKRVFVKIPEATADEIGKKLDVKVVDGSSVIRLSKAFHILPGFFIDVEAITPPNEARKDASALLNGTIEGGAPPYKVSLAVHHDWIGKEPAILHKLPTKRDKKSGGVSLRTYVPLYPGASQARLIVEDRYGNAAIKRLWLQHGRGSNVRVIQAAPSAAKERRRWDAWFRQARHLNLPGTPLVQLVWEGYHGGKGSTYTIAYKDTKGKNQTVSVPMQPLNLCTLRGLPQSKEVTLTLTSWSEKTKKRGTASYTLQRRATTLPPPPSLPSPPAVQKAGDKYPPRALSVTPDLACSIIAIKGPKGRCTWNSKGDIIYLHDWDGYLHRVEVPRFTSKFKLHAGTGEAGTALSQDSLLCAGHNQKALWILNPDTLSVKHQLPIDDLESLSATPQSPLAVVVSQEARILTVVDTPTGTVLQRHDLKTIRRAVQLKKRTFAPIHDFRNATLSPDGQFLFCGSSRLHRF